MKRWLPFPANDQFNQNLKFQFHNKSAISPRDVPDLGKDILLDLGTEAGHRMRQLGQSGLNLSSGKVGFVEQSLQAQACRHGDDFRQEKVVLTEIAEK